MAAPKNILITTDLSEKARAAIEYGFSMASQMGVTPTVLYVLRDFHWSFLVPDHRWGQELQGKKFEDVYLEINNRAAQEEFDWIRARGKEYDLDVETRIEEGDVVDRILEVAEEFDLVVMATAGRGKIAANLVGQISRRVLRRATCPVLLVQTESRRSKKRE